MIILQFLELTAIIYTREHHYYIQLSLVDTLMRKIRGQDNCYGAKHKYKYFSNAAKP